MSDFGVTSSGFVRKTLQDILGEIESDQRAEIDPNFNVAADQPNGQNNGIFARQLDQLWEQAQKLYDANDPDAAEDDALENLSKLTGTPRRAASYSRVVIACNLDDGAFLENGVSFVSVEGNGAIRFTLDVPAPFSYTQVGAGTPDLPFRAENPGPVEADANTLTVISTPTPGWNFAQNSLAATPGRTVDDDPTLRQRRNEQLTASGSSTVDALASDLRQLEGIESCTPFENTTNATDSNGLPGHSFEMLVHDGDPPAVTDDTIAQTIWDSRPSGIRSYGSESGTAIDADGGSHTVNFSRAEFVDIYLEFTLETNADYVGDSTLKSFVAAVANAYFKTAGKDVIYAALVGLPLQVGGVTNVLSLKLGFSASPTLSADLPIGVRQLARFDSTRVDAV